MGPIGLKLHNVGEAFRSKKGGGNIGERNEDLADWAGTIHPDL